MGFPSRLLAALCAVLAVQAASAQATGRFTQGSSPQLPGFDWSPNGFRASESNGQLFKFEDQAESATLVSATSRTAEWTVRGGRHAPTDLRVNLRTPGFEMKVRQGFRFKLDSLRPPLFTTSVGTYEGAPAPASRWIMVSFRDDQPPLLFAFRQGVSEMRALGSAGQWEVRLSPAYEGWIKVQLPFGQRPPATNETLIERLGRQASSVQRLAPFITGPSPKTQSQRVLENRGAMRLEWAFDVPGAVLPTAPLLAGQTSGVQVTTPYKAVSPFFSSGPLALSSGTGLSIYLPHGPLPLGRALTVGAWTEKAAQNERAFLAALPLSLRDSLPDSVLKLYEKLARRVPTFGQSEAYMPQAKDDYRLFAEAAARQAKWISEGLLPDSSSLALNALLWQMDPITWTLSSGLDHQADAARAALLLQTPERRIEGLMLAYGLLAQHQLSIKRREMGFSEVNPAPQLPQDIKVMLGLAPPGKDWTRLLSAPFWLQAGPPAWLRKGERTWVLLFMAEGPEPLRMIFRSRTPVQFQAATNVAQLKPSRLGDSPGVWKWSLEARPKERGLVEIRLITPEADFVPVPPTVLPD